MYIGLDLGTSGLRALLADEAGVIVATADAAYSVSTPHSGWSEQDPSDWVEACKTVMAELKETHPIEVSAVRGIGLSGHMHGATLVDSKGLFCSDFL